MSAILRAEVCSLIRSINSAFLSLHSSLWYVDVMSHGLELRHCLHLNVLAIKFFSFVLIFFPTILINQKLYLKECRKLPLRSPT